MDWLFEAQGANGVYWASSINPYRRGSRRHAAWLRGWRRARREQRRRRSR
jgi:hypothetical protein